MQSRLLTAKPCVGPREIAIFRRSAVTAIYGPNSKCYRSAQYDNPSPDAAESSIVGTRDPVAHRRRKRAWDRGLGFRGVYIVGPTTLFFIVLDANVDFQHLVYMNHG